MINVHPSEDVMANDLRILTTAPQNMKLPGVNKYGSWRSVYSGDKIKYRYWNPERNRPWVLRSVATVYTDNSMNVHFVASRTRYVFQQVGDPSPILKETGRQHGVPDCIRFLLMWNSLRCVSRGIQIQDRGDRHVHDFHGEPLARPTFSVDELYSMTNKWSSNPNDFWDDYPDKWFAVRA
ncbi:uncharacterized protein LOC62_02G002000 [Vanrija pseudolonga]|uniref:Uncharacterized protein n=1 Tax=Vanrija pseudolonga TaxID=143232 RepID=A0AAF0Y305_9TREE|nr:hypothetical protein LOC62_02G002000 [Vanrija pseudolonga]